MQIQEKLKLLEQRRRKGNLFIDILLFVVAIVIKVPIIHVVLLPLALLSVLAKRCKRRSGKRPQTCDVTDVNPSRKPRNSRKYDLVLVGATGFTGQLCGQYLAKRYGLSQVKWAIAGRSKAKLEEIKAKWQALNPTMKNLEVLSMNLDNDEQIAAVVEDTKVIISTAGPFSLSGTKLVAKCAQNGTDYCDITGEVAWVRQMAQKYDNIAAKSGARIVSCCGCDSTPWDIAVFSTVSYLKGKFPSDEIVQINCFDDLHSQFSGGTLATLINSLENKQENSKSKVDPLQKIPGKDEYSQSKFNIRIQGILISYNKIMKQFMGNFALAAGNSCIVKKSNAILNYGSQVRYYEGLVQPNFFQAFNAMIDLIIMGMCVFNPCIRKFLIGTILPKQGQGPSEKTMDNGYMDLKVFVENKSGQRALGNLQFFDDPGYRETGRMLAEAGLCFILNSAQITCGGGFHTTASCFGDVLLQRLINHEKGCEFTAKHIPNLRPQKPKDE